MEKAILELNDELCVSVPIQNLTCKPVFLSSRDVLGQIQPITVAPEPKVVAALLAWDTSNEQPIDTNSRGASLLENTHFQSLE